MTTTDGFEWPQNDPLFDLSLDLIAEGIAGTGVLSTGDLQVTATANTNEIQVATGTLWYGGATYTLGSAETHTLSSNSSGADRWDLVYFDTGTGASGVREGTSGSAPEPPALQSGEFGIAYVYVADGETDVSDSEIKNWRAFADRADATYLEDSDGNFNSETVEGAFTELGGGKVDESGDTMTGELRIDTDGRNLSLLDSDSTGDAADEWRATHTDGDLSLSFYDDSAASSTTALSLLSSGGVSFPNGTVTARGSPAVDVRGDIVDDATTVWDSTTGEVPDAALGSIVNSTLANDSVTVSAGTNLSGGGSAPLGGSTTLDLDTHSTTHEKGGSDELTAFGSTTHDSVDTDQARIGAGFSESTKHIPPEGLPLTTEGQVEIWVDSANGDNDNDGTQSNPVETIAEAWDRVAALQMNHSFAVKVQPGTYNGPLPRMPPRVFVGHEPHTGPFSLLEGQGASPSDVVVDLELEPSVHCIEVDDPLLENFQMESTLRPKSGHFRVDNVVFTGNGSLTQGAAVKAHNTCKLQMRDCEFQSGCDHAVAMSMGGEVYLYNPTGTVSDYAILANNSGRVYLEQDTSGFGGERGLYDLGTGGQVIDGSGRHYLSDQYLADDFGDGKIQNRIQTQAAGYRPEWSIDGGSPSAEDGYLVVPAGDSTVQELSVLPTGGFRMVNGEWVVDFEFQSTQSTSSFSIYPWFENGDNRRRIGLTDSGTINVRRTVGGTQTDEISGPWGADTNRHTLRLVRSEDIDGNGNAGVELFYDGSSVGTDTNDYVPNLSNFIDLRIVNGFDAACHIHNIEVRKFEDQV